ncbi:three-Cys-motif partner protein TcmP [Apibacter mensalis]|uniref:three-Cys-motif partner protein TcmP n=1 Tax=Apibacter mensalis TaxID=1586267 RepID=UPI0026EB3147|nr:three-Cys-motif partner protein TcmP [Apibacter mensalis]
MAERIAFKKDSNLEDHSKAKVNLLGIYLNLYLSIIANDGYTQKINLFDMFCGAGLYKNGGKGSPLVILSIVKSVYEKIIKDKPLHKQAKIDCYFNDINSESVDNLKKTIDSEQLHDTQIGNINYSVSDYKNKLDNIKTIISKRNNKGFIFIDPCGYKDFSVYDIKKLMDCNGHAEVLLWLPTQFMYRFSDKGTPEVLTKILEETTNFSNLKHTDNIYTFIDRFKDGLRNKLENYYVDTFTIKKEANTVFCLFFFTSHIRGFEKMLEAKWKLDAENGKGWSYENNSNQIGLFSGLVEKNELEEKLKKFLSNNNRYNGEVFEFVLKNGYLTKHAVEILKNWKNTNRLEVIETSTHKIKKNAFYLKYYKEESENKKVYFKLNKDENKNRMD